ncbi:hypothetical protein ABZ646_41255, partial [Streptomyces sp. NPDC007162]
MSEKQPRPAVTHTVRTVDGTTVVTLFGELDLLAAVPLRSRLDALSQPSTPPPRSSAQPSTSSPASAAATPGSSSPPPTPN